MVRQWTHDDNYVAIGYLKAAIENFNERATQVKNEDDSEDVYYRVPVLTGEQQKRLVENMQYSFDTLTEKEAYEKGCII